MMLRSTATVTTEAPTRYAKQLLAHLGRKTTVEPLDDGDDAGADGGRLVFAYGLGTVRPGVGQLLLVAEAQDAEGLAHVEDVLARHLERFGARRELVVSWVPAQEPPSAPPSGTSAAST